MSTTSTGYARAHYAARKQIGSTCASCGTSGPVQAALRPDVPVSRLRTDELINSRYSDDPEDYFALCVPCHRRLDLVELRPRCKRGHEYTPDNTSIKTDGSRRCLTCHRQQQARRKAALAARFEHGESGAE